MTDGYVGNEPEVLATVRENLGSARIFSFGVGTSVNRYLIEGLATVGNGAAAFVSLDEGTSPAVDKFYEQVKHAALVDIAIDWHGLAATDVYPKRLPDLLVGRPMVICGRFTGELPRSVAWRAASA